MGSVKKLLSSAKLPPREEHHSRFFVDLAENIHIHFREYRIVFDLDEYFEFVNLLFLSTADVENFLKSNPDYSEGSYPTTLMVGGGRSRQLKFLKNSPAPNRSRYFDDELAIELQDEYVTDEVHIHYRDFRIGLDRGRFKILAAAFHEAGVALNEFEQSNSYQRTTHPDRIINSFNQSMPEVEDKMVVGAELISVDDILVPEFPNFPNDFDGSEVWITDLRSKLRSGSPVSPCILGRLDAGSRKYELIDGHHRMAAAMLEGKTELSCVVIDGQRSAFAHLRAAQTSLALFDDATGRKYDFSGFFQYFSAISSDSSYKHRFRNARLLNTKVAQIFRLIVIRLGLKKVIFKIFFDRKVRDV